MTPGRRTLRFESIDEIMPEVDRLARGCSTVGAWSLAQICGHLATVIEASLAAPATANADTSLRFSPEKRAAVFESRSIPEGLPMPPAVAAYEAGGLEAEAARLRNAIAAIEASPGPAAPHRFFGPLAKDEFKNLQCVHCAHHLSFAIPVEA